MNCHWEHKPLTDMRLIAQSMLVVGFTAIAAAVFMNRYEYVVFHPFNSSIEVIQRFNRLTGNQCTVLTNSALLELAKGDDIRFVLKGTGGDLC
jgi:hypothetical protein